MCVVEMRHVCSIRVLADYACGLHNYSLILTTTPHRKKKASSVEPEVKN